MSDATDAIKKMKAKSKEEAPAAPAYEAPKLEPKAAPEPENIYQQYTCSRVSTCMITPLGKRANFTNYEYYTKDPDIIEYLDAEIEFGVRGIKKGALVAAEDINPMAALKRQHIEEFLASQEGRDYSSGTLSKAELARKAGMLSTSGVTTHA
jgi:hypothetical protein